MVKLCNVNFKIEAKKLVSPTILKIYLPEQKLSDILKTHYKNKFTINSDFHQIGKKSSKSRLLNGDVNIHQFLKISQAENF